MNTFLTLNQDRRLLGDGLILLKELHGVNATAVFFDPQYREVMDAMQFGNEGKSRQSKRVVLPQMDSRTICDFLTGIAHAVAPGGYVFWWMDKFTIGEGIHAKMLEQVNAGLAKPNRLHAVDVLIWDKGRIGMGSRLRRRFEPCYILQRTPKSVKNWTNRAIPDVWQETIPNPRSGHPHKKPVRLTMELIGCVSKPGDVILDPCAGSFMTMTAARILDRHFIGCDLSPEHGIEPMRITETSRLSAHIGKGVLVGMPLQDKQ